MMLVNKFSLEMKRKMMWNKKKSRILCLRRFCFGFCIFGRMEFLDYNLIDFALIDFILIIWMRLMIAHNIVLLIGFVLLPSHYTKGSLLESKKIY